jgi:prophage regulatory protein
MTGIQQGPIPFHFMRKREVFTTLGVSKSTLEAWVSVGKFPPSIALSPTVKVWVSTEVEAWMHARMAERDARQPLAA